ncbi:hypothetical protein KI387_021293, partial [Taxus chinensis]
YSNSTKSGLNFNFFGVFCSARLSVFCSTLPCVVRPYWFTCMVSPPRPALAFPTAGSIIFPCHGLHLSLLSYLAPMLPCWPLLSFWMLLVAPCS